MAVLVGFCQAEVVTDVNFQLGDPPGTLQYFVGLTAITSPVVISNASTIGSIQTDIDNNLVYQSSGYTILITAGLPQITALITIASTTQISSNATGVFLGTNPDTGTGSFVCNLATRLKKKNRAGALPRCPDEIIFNADTQNPQVRYCNNIYNFYGMDEQALLHYIKSTSNISQRNSRNWWVLNI